jgi:polyisoprenoid-binding protein YceI
METLLNRSLILMKYLKRNSVKKFGYLLMGVIIVGLSAFAVALANWKVKGEYEVKFENGSMHGTFKGLKADIQFDKAHPEEAKISATIDATSLATGFFIKTSHAKDAIDAEKYPTISFISSSVSKSGSAYQAMGKLTLKGVTKPVTIHFTFDDKGNEGVFKGDFKIVPKDFTITKNGAPDELTIHLNVPVSKS